MYPITQNLKIITLTFTQIVTHHLHKPIHNSLNKPAQTLTLEACRVCVCYGGNLGVQATDSGSLGAAPQPPEAGSIF